MRTRYTIATSWLVLLLCTLFALNSGTAKSQASSSEDLKSLLSIANAAVSQPQQPIPVLDSMRATGTTAKSPTPAAVSSPAYVKNARSNIDRYIDVATAIDPKLGEILANLCGDQGQDPVELERMIRRYGRNLVALAELKQSDPAFYAQKIIELNLDAEVGKVARTLRQVIAGQGDDSREAVSLRAQLELLMRARLTISIKNREHSIERLDEHIDRLRERVVHDELNFDAELERQLNQMLGELNAVEAALGR